MFTFNDITFRAVEETDLKLLYSMRMDEGINECLFTIYPISLTGQKKWLENMLNNDQNKVFMIDAHIVYPKGEHTNEYGVDQTIGYVRLSNIDHINKKIEIGADICSGYRGKGYGKKVYTALQEYCFQYLGMHQLYLYVLSSNLQAIKCYEAVGFELTATLKDWVYKRGYQDVRLYVKHNKG